MNVWFSQSFRNTKLKSADRKVNTYTLMNDGMNRLSSAHLDEQKTNQSNNPNEENASYSNNFYKYLSTEHVVNS